MLVGLGAGLKALAFDFCIGFLVFYTRKRFPLTNFQDVFFVFFFFFFFRFEAGAASKLLTRPGVAHRVLHLREQAKLC